jgi:FlaA1/EpsC-like NDP-sugar epimerase
VLSGTNEVIVYGAGEVGRALLAVAPDSGLAIRCLVDRNAALWGQAIEGIPICSLSNAMKLGLHKYLIASFSYIDEIKKQIESCYNGMDTKPLILWERM